MDLLKYIIKLNYDKKMIRNIDGVVKIYFELMNLK